MKDRRGPFSSLHVLITTTIVNRRTTTNIIRLERLKVVNIIVVN